ncbi:MAG: LysR family transcriptional regulator [Polaromonas sp.]|jgi:DNA-binding transcriptional LysR family regulator|nr:LysR family transcriptional regulator [Polaromonas sp.]
MNLLASLRYLAALDEHRHFGRAAQACHITQPALSNALRALEEEFGTAIVKRGRSFGGFTAEGERVLASAQRMLHERELLQQDLNSVAGKPRGSLSIGAVPTAMPIAARFSAMLQARHPGIAPVVLSMSSSELENGLDNLSLDMGLGYTERMARHGRRLRHVAQYTEHYFLVRRAGQIHSEQMQIGPKMSWLEASVLPLCLLTPEMHNRAIIDAAFEMAGASVKPAIETNSILTLALSVVVGEVCSVLPGALIGAVRGYRELEALPLSGPEVRTAIGFMIQAGDRTSRTLDAAMTLAQDAAWLRHAAAHSGLLAA